MSMNNCFSSLYTFITRMSASQWIFLIGTHFWNRKKYLFPFVLVEKDGNKTSFCAVIENRIRHTYLLLITSNELTSCNQFSGSNVTGCITGIVNNHFHPISNINSIGIFNIYILTSSSFESLI